MTSNDLVRCQVLFLSSLLCIHSFCEACHESMGDEARSSFSGSRT